MLTHDGSNTPTRIILAAMMLLVFAGTAWNVYLLATGGAPLGGVLGIVLGALFLAVGVWMWLRMPAIKPYVAPESAAWDAAKRPIRGPK